MTGTVPRMLRPIFSRRRGLLGELCHIVERLLIQACSGAGVEGRPGLILFVQTFGDLVSFNPHIHVLAADGVFRADGVPEQRRLWRFQGLGTAWVPARLPSSRRLDPGRL